MIEAGENTIPAATGVMVILELGGADSVYTIVLGVPGVTDTLGSAIQDPINKN